MSTSGTYLKLCEREQLKGWLESARQHADQRRDELRQQNRDRWASICRDSPRRVVVDVRHDPGLDVFPATMTSTRDLPGGEHRGSRVVPLVHLPEPLRVCVVEEELGAILLHSHPYRDDVDGTVDRFGRHIVQTTHEHREGRVTKREIARGGHRSLVRRVPMPRHYNLEKLRRTLKLWALGDIDGLCELYPVVRDI